MSYRNSLAAFFSLIILAACGGSSDAEDRAEPTPPAVGPGGDPVTGIVTAQFDAAAGQIPFPNNLLLQGTTDLTLNIPVDDPTDFSDPQVALNALDGFSTTAPWTATFSEPIDPDTVVPGSSVRVYEVSLEQGGIAVTGVNEELTPGQDYIATVAPTDPSGQTLAVVPLRPLQEATAYMAVLTEGIGDMDGNPATASEQYFLAKRPDPLVDADGNSTEPLLDDATAQQLEPLRQIISTHEEAAAAAGVSRDSIVLSWTVTTQAVTPVLSAISSATQPSGYNLAPTGMNTGELVPGSPGIADVFIGTLDLPYYLGVPDESNPAAPLTDFWQAEPGAYVPPFDQAGLDPESTNVTVANPFPVQTDEQTVPVLLTVPNDASGQVRPGSGWPVVIFQHGITGDRSNMLALADTMASIGFATIAIDMPLHGVTDTDPTDPEQPLAALYVGNTPFADIANERTFDLDLEGTGQPDDSGSYFINLESLLTSRDNLRQAQADLVTLARTIPQMDFSGDGVADFDGSAINFAGLSLGAMTGIPFMTVEDTVSNGVLSAPGGGIVPFLVASEQFGPVITGGLADAGVEPGSAEFNQFVLAAQTVIDSADPINWGATAAATNSVLLHQIANDPVVPNAVEGQPLAGTEPLISVMGLDSITGSTEDPDGIRGAVRFIEGGHGSLLDPSDNPAVTEEMQSQAASMIQSGGTAVIVTNDSVISTD